MDILKLYQDYGIEHLEGGHKHCRPGWVNTACPFCSGNPGYHLGYCINPSDKFYNRFICWRCKGKGTVRAIAALLGVPQEKAKEIVIAYGGNIKHRRTRYSKPVEKPVIPIRLPQGSLPLHQVPRACEYLKNRGFNPQLLESEWDLYATEHLGRYKFRVVIPIHYKGLVVSFQTRDYTGKAIAKYLSAQEKEESIRHKDILYGLDKAVDWETVLVFEGVTSVWKFGPPAVATFGISYCPAQVRLLAQNFKRVFLLYDPEPQATKQAELICTDLSQRGIKVEQIFLDYPKSASDPAELSDSDVKKIRNELLMEE